MNHRLAQLVALAAITGAAFAVECEGAGAPSKMYTVEGMIEVEPRWAAGSSGPESRPDAPVPPEYYKAYVATQIELIKGHRNLDAALKSLEGKQALYTGPGAAARLAKDLKVEHRPDTFLISVSLSNPGRQEIHAIVTEVLNQYIQQVREDWARSQADQQRELRTERDDLRAQLTDLRRRLAALRDESNVTLLDPAQSEARERLSLLLQQMLDAQNRLLQAKTDWDRFQKLKPEDSPKKDLAPLAQAFPEILERLAADPVLGALEHEVARLQVEAEEAKALSDAKDDRVAKVNAGLAARRKVLEERRAATLARLADQQGAIIKYRYDFARDLEAELLSRLAEARTAAVGYAKLADDYRAREQEVANMQRLLDDVTGQLERMRINSALARPTIRVICWPVLPID